MGVVVGTIGAPSGTGNITVSGLPFEPVAVVFWNQFQLLAPPGQMFGCATSSSDQWVIWTGMDVESSVYNKRYNEARTDFCIYNRGAPYTGVAYAASLVSFNSDGFTINVSTFASTGEDIHYMAVGGNVSAAHAGTFSAGNPTGTTAVTDPGFQPKALIVAHQLEPAWDAGQKTNARWGVGVADWQLNQYSSYVQIPIAPGAFKSVHRTDAVACAYDGTDLVRVELDSMDATGFTVDVVDAFSADITFGYLALEAVAATAGFGVQPDSTGVQTFTGLDHEPQGVFFCFSGVDIPSMTGTTGDPHRPGVGAMSETDQSYVSMIMHPVAPFGVVTTDGYGGAGQPMEFRGSGSGIGPNDNDPLATASFESFAQGEFAIEWTLADSGNDRAFGWLALPGHIQFRWIPHIYRRLFATGGDGPVPPVPPPEFLLLEGGDRLVLEDGSGFLLL